MITSSICCGSKPARSTAALTARAPSCVAVKDFRVPWNLPIGVRTPLMMTMSFMLCTSRDKLCQKTKTSAVVTVDEASFCFEKRAFIHGHYSGGLVRDLVLAEVKVNFD